MRDVFVRILISFTALALVFAASACRAKYKPLESSLDPGFSASELAHSRIVVNHAAPGCYNDGDGRAYPRSGVRTSNVIYAICKAYNHRTQLHGTVFENVDEMIDDLNARGVPADYVIFAVINNWEDHATEWSGIPDRIDVALGLYRVRDRRCVAFEHFKASSKWATFGGDHPQDLLEKPIKVILARWFNRPILTGIIDAESIMLRATIR